MHSLHSTWVDRLHGAPSGGCLAEEQLSHAHDCHGGLADVQNGTDLLCSVWCVVYRALVCGVWCAVQNGTDLMCGVCDVWCIGISV
jgi:hypothetical protein